MIISLIIFIWLQKSGGANMHFFKSGGAKAPLPPASDAYASGSYGRQAGRLAGWQTKYW